MSALDQKKTFNQHPTEITNRSRISHCYLPLSCACDRTSAPAQSVSDSTDVTNSFCHYHRRSYSSGMLFPAHRLLVSTSLMPGDWAQSPGLDILNIHLIKRMLPCPVKAATNLFPYSPNCIWIDAAWTTILSVSRLGESPAKFPRSDFLWYTCPCRTAIPDAQPPVVETGDGAHSNTFA